jgi:flagellar biosynthesis/type III secretory pathway M-ring protein FliF/YscJ
VCPITDNPGSFTGADDVLTAQQQAEKVYAQKVVEQLPFINGVLVSVTVDIEIQTQTKSEEVFDPTKVASKEQLTESDTTEENNVQPGAAEPGAIPNSPLSVGPSGGSASAGGTSSTREHTTTKLDNRFSKANIQTSTPAGQAPRPARGRSRAAKLSHHAFQTGSQEPRRRYTERLPTTIRMTRP